MAHELSSGALETIMNGGTVDNPVMQILGSKKMSGGSSADRYRLLISDGKHLNSFAMLATQLNEKVISGELSDFTIVQLNRLITSMVNNSGKGEKRVMIILDVTVLTPGEQVGERIGNPMSYDDPSNPSVSAPSEASTRPQQQQPPPRTYNNYQETKPNVSAVSSSPGGGDDSTVPITSLNPYQNRWSIKARCTAKSAIKTWSNARSEGKLFSMDFLDETGEIRCTAFKEAVDKFYNTVEIGKLYFVSNCTLKTANKQYTHIKHDYEMTVNHNTIIVACNDTVSSIPSIIYDFLSIDKIANLEDGATLDIIGVCIKAGEINTITSRATNKEFIKRDVTLVDETNSSVNLTLWSAQATDFDSADSPVVVIKGARMKEFGGGKTISAQLSSTLLINPDIAEAHRLRGWYENVSANQEYSSVSARGGAGGDMMSGGNGWVTFRQMKSKQLGCGDKPDYIMVKATIITTKHDRSIYQACASEKCNKKIIDLQNGMYRCEKCNREDDSFKYRMMTRFNLGDHTTNQFVTAFQEQSESILGMTAQELGEMEKSDPQKFQDVFNEANFKSFVFKLRVKMETYNDTSSLKATVVALQNPIDYKSYNAHLITEIKRLSGMNKPTK